MTTTTKTFDDEAIRAMTRVALCNRLTAILEQAAEARKAIVDFDAAGEHDGQGDLGL